jgi:hypothetical protein
MLKADRVHIERLASKDEAIRLSAASELEALELGHFEDHPVSRKLVAERESALVQAFHETASPLVREWVVQVLAEGSARGPGVTELVKSALEPHCEFLPTLLYYVYCTPAPFADVKDKVKLLHDHPDEQVRWRCALVLSLLPLEHERDIDVVRQLLTDRHGATRSYAVEALRKMGRITGADRPALEEAIRLDEGPASTSARALLRSLE